LEYVPAEHGAQKEAPAREVTREEVFGEGSETRTGTPTVRGEKKGYYIYIYIYI
jgi:hypothetical protein